MRRTLSVLTALGLLTAMPVLAEKPDWAGKGKSSQQELKNQGDAVWTQAGDDSAQMKQKANRERVEEQYTDAGKGKEKKEKQLREQQQSESQAMEKQRAMKQEQVRREEAKGSEQGQASRQEHSRKWWKFWE